MPDPLEYRTIPTTVRAAQIDTDPEVTRQRLVALLEHADIDVDTILGDTVRAANLTSVDGRLVVATPGEWVLEDVEHPGYPQPSPWSDAAFRSSFRVPKRARS